MNQRLSIVALIATLINCIEGKTGLRCYDAVPLDAESPFYFVELVSVQPKNTKSMYVDSFNCLFHCIAPQEENNSSVGIYSLIQGLQEALTHTLYLNEPFNLLRLEDNGVSIIKTDETGEKHAVCSITIDVAYGFICK